MENSGFGRLIGVLVSPGKTFQSIAERPTWALPLVVLLFLSAVIGYVTAQRTDYRDVVTQRGREKGGGGPRGAARAADRDDGEGRALHLRRGSPGRGRRDHADRSPALLGR